MTTDEFDFDIILEDEFDAMYVVLSSSFVAMTTFSCS